MFINWQRKQIMQIFKYGMYRDTSLHFYIGHIHCSYFVENLFHISAVISDDYQLLPGFQGRNVSLPCNVFLERPQYELIELEWKTAAFDHKPSDWKVAAHMRIQPRQGFPHYSEKFKSRADLSPATGELAIIGFKREDEGLYQCFVEGRHSAVIHLKSYGG